MLFAFAVLLFAFGGCGDGDGSRKSTDTPLDSLKAYTQAIKKNDVREMKKLLSKGSLQMAREEARAQGSSEDEVIKRETLFSPDQRTVEFRNEKIEGDTATIEMKNSYGSWDIVPFVREEGEWKIAKDRYADELMKQAEEKSRQLDEQINQSRQQELQQQSPQP